VNKLKARICQIESTDQLSIVDFDANGDTFTAIVIETPQTAGYLRVGNSVYLLFKETEVSLAKNLSGQISIRNCIHSTVRGVEHGKLLSRVVLNYAGTEIVSVVTSRSATRLDIKEGDQVTWLVKTNEISIMEHMD
jgi:molybdopterin-binding protein